MCAHMCVLPSTCACTCIFMCTCVRFGAHVRASMCKGIPSCVHVGLQVLMRVLPSTVHVHFQVHMRVLPNTCACKHVQQQTLMRASCAQACAAEHMCAQACVTAYLHPCRCGFMFTCVCYRPRVRARETACAHACGSEHICVQVCVSCGEQPCTAGRPARLKA